MSVGLLRILGCEGVQTWFCGPVLTRFTDDSVSYLYRDTGTGKYAKKTYSVTNISIDGLECLAQVLEVDVVDLLKR